MLNLNKLIDKLQESAVLYELHKHQALYTVNDSVEKRGLIKGAHSKNLFLKNKKNQLFLFSCLENTNIELKKLSKSLNIGNISFAKESILKLKLGVEPGSVSPFGLLNDKNHDIEFYLDSNFLQQKTINFHPLVNTATISLSPDSFINFLIENKKKVNIFDFNNYTLIK